MSIPDITRAVSEFLRADAAVAALAETRIYYSELPPSKVAVQAKDAPLSVVLRKAGGPPDSARIRYQRQRIDAICYGPTPARAAVLELAVYDALKQMQPHDQGTCRLWDAVVLTSAVEQREPETQWPLVFRSYLVSACEVPVPV